MKTTANYALQIPEATDTVNLLTQNYPNFETIDTAMKANKDAAITTATEVKTGTNHAIIRSNTDSSMFRFVATSNMVAGDTFTVDSVVCTATTPDGQSLGAGAFVINQNVLCCLTGTLLTIYAGGSASTEVEKAKTAENAEKLGGELPEYYGTADAVTANTQAIDGLTNDVSDLNDKVAKIDNTYSAEEKAVGTWVDGKVVYEKCFNITTTTPYNTTITLDSTLTYDYVDSLIQLTGYMQQESYYNWTKMYPSDTGYNEIITKGGLTIKTPGNMIHVVVIIRYTKK